MALTLTLDGPPEVLDPLLPLFARWHGWTPGGEQTAAQYARDVIARYLREGVTGQAAEDARAAAVAAAKAQATQAADLLTLTLIE